MTTPVRQLQQRLPVVRSSILGAGLLLLLLLLIAQPLGAQEDGELLGVQRDQNRIGLRLSSLREKMDRLVDRYDSEGRTHNAKLLRAAIEQFDQAGLLDQSREIDRGLESAMLSTVSEQDSLVSGLESLYAVLRDRRDVDELRSQADLLGEGIDELDRLAKEERRLRQETLAASDTAAGVLDEALAEAQRLSASLQEGDAARQILQTTKEALGEVALAEFLARRQRVLAEDPATGADAERSLAEGAARLLAGLSQPLEGAQGSELLQAAQSQRGRARESVAAALDAMTRAAEQLAAAEPGAGQQGRDPRAQQGDPARGHSGDPATEASGSPTAAAQGSEGRSGESSSGSSGEEPGGPSGGEPGQDQESGPGQQGRAEESNASSSPARKSMAEAGDRLDQARSALAESERTLAAARNRARAMAAAAARQAQARAEELKRDAQRLEATEPEAGPELLDRTRDLLAELARMSQALQSQRLDQAAQQASGAEQNLNEILAQLRRRRESADEGPREPQTAEQLAAAVASQQELKRRLRELMDRLTELPDQQFQQPGSQADSAMDAAAEARGQGRDQEAAQRQQEASESLEEARKKLQGERDRYEQLRQEEVLFQLGEKLQELLDEQLAASAETREIDEARGDRERLSRSHRRAVVRLSETERSLSREAASIAGELSADGAKVFVFAIEQIAEDLEAAADELADQETGELLASIQQGVEQRLADLTAVLTDELERRREAMAEMDPEDSSRDQGSQGKQPLVPPVAELLLFQRMHGEDDAEGLDAMELTMLERWALEHSRTTSLFESMIPAEPEPAVDAQGQPLEPGEGVGEGSDPGAKR